MTQHQGQKTAVCRYVVDSRYDAWKPLHSSGKYRVKLSYMEHGKPSALIHYIDSHPAYVNPLRVHELERQFAQGTVLEQLRLLTVLASERERKVTNALQALYPVPRWAYASAELFYAYQRSRWGAAQDPGIYVPYNVISPEHQTHRGRPEVITIEFSTVGVPFRWLLSVASQWDGIWSLRWEEPPRFSTFTNSVDTIDQSPIYGGIIDIPDTKDRTAYVVQLGATEQNVLYSLLDKLSSHHGQKLLEEFERVRNTAFIFTSDTFVYYYPHGRITMNNNVIAKTTTLSTAAIINTLDDGEHELLESLAATLSQQYGYPVVVRDFRIENNHDDVIELWLCCEEVVPNGVLHEATRRNVRRGEEEHTLFGTEVRVQSEILYGSATAGEVIEVIREGL